MSEEQMQLIEQSSVYAKTVDDYVQSEEEIDSLLEKYSLKN